MPSSDILIIGAGICGLMTALQLKDSGVTARLLDKGRSVGGRLATRRLATGRADHGAQFFTVRDGSFRRYVEEWQQAGLVFQWSTGWSDGSLDEQRGDGYPRYAVRGGMNALAKHLASQVSASPSTEFVTNLRVGAVEHDGERWTAIGEDGRRFDAATLVMTAPVPQSIELLTQGGISLPAVCRQELEPIEYAPCLCGLYRVDGHTTLPDPGALQRPRADISWIADNRRKGISPDVTTVTVHASADFSRKYYGAPDPEVEPLLREALLPFLEDEAAIVEAQVKRWRYALPLVLYPQRYLKALDLPSLYFGGDAFGGPRVEGAALSGLAIGQLLAAEGSDQSSGSAR